MKMTEVLRWVLAVLLLAALALTVAGPAIAEEPARALPLDITEGGRPPKAENWVYDGKIPVSYEDSTIRVSVERGEITLTVKKKKVKHETFVVRVQIKDPSQLRTAMSKDTYTGRGRVEGESMAKGKNAVVAINGDFFKYEYDVGYVVRQGVFYRDATNNSRHKFFDMLVIDDQGDFYPVYHADTAAIERFRAEELPEGRTILDTFNLGPVLVVDGEAQDISASTAAKQGDLQWSYPQQRICIVQMGPLDYAIVEVYGRTDSTAGMSLQEFADFVAEQCPGARLAYNLDGGGSTNLIVNNKRICKTPGHREITDILYFASAED